MLELLRVLSRSETRLRHTVLFLFNGAEETPLQAAHGFITKHEWAKDIRGTNDNMMMMTTISALILKLIFFESFS